MLGLQPNYGEVCTLRKKVGFEDHYDGACGSPGRYSAELSCFNGEASTDGAPRFALPDLLADVLADGLPLVLVVRAVRLGLDDCASGVGSAPPT